VARKKRKKQKNRILRVFMLVFLVYAGYIFAAQQMDINKFHKLEAAKINEKNEIIARNNMLKNRLSATDTEAFKERAAREKLGLVKSGEIVYINKNESK